MSYDFGFGFSVLNVGNDLQISITEHCSKAGDRIKTIERNQAKHTR